MGAFEYPFVSSPVPVPYVWLNQYPLLVNSFGSNYMEAATADIDGDGHATWQEYVTGTDPTNGESVLKAFITISNGSPRLAWTPDLGATRVYTVEGKSNLIHDAWGPTNAHDRFYRVKVTFP